MSYAWTEDCATIDNPSSLYQVRKRARQLGVNVNTPDICAALNHEMEQLSEQNSKCLNANGHNLEFDSFENLPPGYIFSVMLENGNRVCYDIRDLVKWIYHTHDVNVYGNPRLSPGREFQLNGPLEDLVLKRAKALLSVDEYRDITTQNYEFIRDPRVKTLVNDWDSKKQTATYRILRFVPSGDRRYSALHGKGTEITIGKHVDRRFIYFTKDHRHTVQRGIEREEQDIMKIFSGFFFNCKPGLGMYRMKLLDAGRVLERYQNESPPQMQKALRKLANKASDKTGITITVSPHGNAGLFYKFTIGHGHEVIT